MDDGTLLVLSTVAVLTVTITAVFCRYRVIKNKTVAWWIGILGILIASLGTVLLIFGADIFRARFWEDGQKASPWANLFTVGTICLTGAIPSAFATVWYFRRHDKV